MMASMGPGIKGLLLGEDLRERKAKNRHFGGRDWYGCDEVLKLGPKPERSTISAKSRDFQGAM